MSAIKREVIIGDCRLLLGDCRDILPSLHGVDAVVTSPPYDDLRDYGPDFDGLDWRRVIELLHGTLSDGGVCVWNVSDAVREGSETGTSFRQAIHAQSCGFLLHDTMIYEKEQACFGSNHGYLQCFEFMFVWAKGKPKAINLLRDRKNVRARVESVAKGGIAKDGTKAGRTKRQADEYGRRKNIWRYGVGGGTVDHPAVMPEAMARDHILSWTNEQDVVLDPFMGSGTTGAACAKSGRAFVGIELHEPYFDLACERIRAAYAQPDLFVAANQSEPKPVQQPLFGEA